MVFESFGTCWKGQCAGLRVAVGLLAGLLSLPVCAQLTGEVTGGASGSAGASVKTAVGIGTAASVKQQTGGRIDTVDGPSGAAAGALSGEQIAREAWKAAHGSLLKNALSRRKGRDSALVLTRVPRAMRAANRKPTVQSFDTYINNHPADPALDTVQMAILTSGKAKGTGILFTNYADRKKSALITLWLPALRKFRRISEPSHEDTWFGTNLTYGELVLRRPEDETHELLGETVFDDCLPIMDLSRGEQSRYTRHLPKPQCGHKGRPVYRIKSTTKFHKWWYDYHISEVDKDSFSVYRTVYYKAGKKIKTVVVDWQSLGRDDPRITYPRYVYALTHTNGTDSMIFVPRKTIELEADLPDSYWSEKTLSGYLKLRKH